MNRQRIRLKVNGQAYDTLCSENATLLTLLREDLGLTGTKEGCGAGECGACTVILNGRPVNSCMVLALECQDSEVRTIEGETVNGGLSDLQKAFIEHNALQCGFCTPGMIMSARALLDKNPSPTREDICEALEGNLCRCTGYEPIIAAVLSAAGGEVNE
ncbi:MAG: (2Fe-2S)-binding protein [Clostridiales bacterium]|jgi:carbon-monoxide dehydrogenase small subunit|nr:(2Fe-2S)-binding protein [Clostridiales bacterium]